MADIRTAAPRSARLFLQALLPWPAAAAGGAAFALAVMHVSGIAPFVWPPAMAAQASQREASIWFGGAAPRPETLAVLALLRRASEHGLDPADYRVDEITRALAGAADPDRAEANALLSQAVAAYARDLRVPRGLADIVYIDPELAPTAPRLEYLAANGSLAAQLQSFHRFNPLYEELRAGLADYRRRWSGLPQVQIPEGPALAVGSRGARVALLRERLGLASDPAGADRYDAALGAAVLAFREAHGFAARPVADGETIAALNRGAAHYEAVIIANLDRLRGLPVDGGRYVLVDKADARLRMIEGGKEVGAMRVIVGKPGMETPLLAGFIRYAMVNPYWNVPPDLVRNTIAPAVLRDGVGTLERRRFVLSSDWQSTDPLDPGAVDWQAIADGRESVWVRQRPGGRNMMGAVKFMLPNDMGIYLHDTPDKALFARADRRLSSGCVRVEDAGRLALWLFGRAILDGDTTPDRRVDLARPVPVFTTYLTARAEDGQVRFLRDVEGRDPQWNPQGRTAAR